MSWFYHPYPLGDAAATPLPSPIRVTLANRANRQGARDTRRAPRSRLRPPVVVNPPVVYNGPGVVRPRVTNVSIVKRLPHSQLPQVIYDAKVYEPVQGYLTRPLDRVPPTSSRLSPPAVVTTAASPLGIRVKLARAPRRRTASVLTKPVVIDASQGPQGGILIQFAQPPRQSRRTTSRLPKVIYQPVVAGPTYPIQVTLAPQRRGVAKSRLSPPVRQTALAVPALVSLFPLLGRVPAVHSRLRPPETPVKAPFAPLSVNLTYSRRGKPRSKLSPPAWTRSFGKIETTFAPQKRGKPKSFLRPPAIQTALAAPSQVILFPLLGRIPTAYSRLAPPTVVNPEASATYGGPRVRLTKPLDTVPRTRYRLRPPVDLVDAADLGYVRTHLAYSRRGAPKSSLHGLIYSANIFEPIRGYLLPRVNVPPVHSKLSGPATLELGYIFGGPHVRMVAVRDRNPKVISRLEPPVVVTAANIYGGPKVRIVRSHRPARTMWRLKPPAAAPPLARAIQVHLVRIKPRPVHSILRRPTDVVDQADLGRIKITLVRIRPRPTDASVFQPAVINQAYGPMGGIGIWLAPSFRGKPKSFLRPPTTVEVVVALAYPTNITLAYSRRGAPKSRLQAPAVAAVAYAPIRGRLTPPRATNPKTVSRLEPPTVVTQPPYPASVTLAYSRRGSAKSRLLPVPSAFQPVGDLEVTLAYSRRGAPKSILNPPTDLVDTQDQGAVSISLAYSRRGKPKSELFPPVVIFPFFARPADITLARIRPAAVHSILRKPVDIVDQADVGYLKTHLAYSRRGAPKSRLLGVIYAGRVYRGIRGTLAPPRATNPHTISRLAPPTVVESAAYAISVTLAPSSRGKPKSHLGPPTVIDLRPQTYYLATWLTYSRRGKPKSLLSKPVFGAPTPKAEYDLRVTLAYQSRGKPKSRLRPPVVVTAATPYFRREPVTLAPQRRGRPESFLRPPVVVGRFIARAVEITLAPSRRGRAKSKLLGTIYGARVYAPIAVSLAPQRRGVPKSILRKPVDLVDRDDLGSVRVSLAPSSRGAPTSFLEPPTVVGQAAFYATSITLAPSSRGKAKSFLRPPAVVSAAFVAPPIEVHLVRIRPVATQYRLLPPAVVAPPVVYPPIRVTLVRIRPVRTIWQLGIPEELAVCYGVVCGEDSGPVVCGDDSAAVVTGSDQAGAKVSGSDDAAKVTGATAPGGTVTGGDERREGC